MLPTLPPKRRFQRRQREGAVVVRSRLIRPPDPAPMNWVHQSVPGMTLPALSYAQQRNTTQVTLLFIHRSPTGKRTDSFFWDGCIDESQRQGKYYGGIVKFPVPRSGKT